MHFTTFITCLLLTSTTGWARYTLQQDYMEGGNFLDQFTFWDTADPTDGFVEYVDQATAQSAGLLSSSASQVQLRVNDQDVTTTGRQSVRLTSTQSYDNGLVILDLEHMPGGICGTWPAFWMVGPNWPNEGEIDIIEGVNDAQTNSMTLHTGDSCSISPDAGMIGSISTTSCDVSSGNNTGCGITTTNTATYGTAFNNNGGGTYATQILANSISVFFWPSGSVPSDVTSGSPMPSSWGQPLAQFSGGCNIPSSFMNLQIVFDTTFCGSWAGIVWPGSTCAASTGQSTCDAYVGQNPSAFTDAYWSINGLKVYSSSGGAESSAAPSPTATTWSAGASQTTFVTATASAWGSTGGPPRGTGFSPPPSHGTSFPASFNPHHGGPSASETSFASATSSAQLTSTAAAAPRGSSAVQSSFETSQTASAAAPPQSSAPRESPPPQESSAPSAPPQESTTQQTSVPAAPTTSAPAQSQTGSQQPSHTGHFGGGFHHRYGGGRSGGQGNDAVQAMTASVSQSVPASTGVAEQEHSVGDGIWDVGVPGFERRRRHLRAHKLRFGHGGGRF